ncbi:hypothetical protein H9P43_003982 [Blastocladiella emersonii ATCC 22665]|nr:hypothetical protein H9P43_003982 [Blastocladiella emersonii ATCC 22665]
MHQPALDALPKPARASLQQFLDGRSTARLRATCRSLSVLSLDRFADARFNWYLRNERHRWVTDIATNAVRVDERGERISVLNLLLDSARINPLAHGGQALSLAARNSDLAVLRRFLIDPQNRFLGRSKTASAHKRNFDDLAHLHKRALAAAVDHAKQIVARDGRAALHATIRMFVAHSFAAWSSIALEHYDLFAAALTDQDTSLEPIPHFDVTQAKFLGRSTDDISTAD